VHKSITWHFSRIQRELPKPSNLSRILSNHHGQPFYPIIMANRRQIAVDSLFHESETAIQSTANARTLKAI
jgi:hypothetical protein